MNPNVDEFLPLAPVTLHILLALAGEKQHGYGMMQEIGADRTAGFGSVRVR